MPGYDTPNLTLLAFFAAKVLMHSEKLMLRANSLSMLNIARSLSRPCVIVDRWKFLIRLSLLNDILQKVKKAKWRWAGHVARREDNRWTKRITEWQPRKGKRKRGRQKRRWRDDLTSYLGTEWARQARDRDRWTMEAGYIQQRMTEPR